MDLNDSKIITELNGLVKQLKNGQRFDYDFNRITETESTELNDLIKNIKELSFQYNANYNFVLDISRGNLDVIPPINNSFANPYKQLQADLKHLTWQINEIAEGDLEQRVSFSGDFSQVINKMIVSLKEKQRLSQLNEEYVLELRELNAMKDRFFSIIGHDLRNPFTGLLALSDLMLTNIQAKEYENLEEYALLLKTFTDQGYKLLLNLLEWARSQTNALRITIETLSLATIVAESKSTIVPIAQQKNIEIVYSCTQDYLVLADVNLLNTVMRNLLSNAVKFTNEKGLIHIYGEESDKLVTVHIEDNGVGISPENLTKLFRLDSHSSTKGTANEEGTGLGLILCKELVEKMNGRLTVESEPGKGTIFSFTLPKA